MYNNKAANYSNTEIMTAQRTKLTLMLYDGAIRFAQEGIERIKRQDISGTGLYISKTQKIISELLDVLDMKRGGDIAKNLFRLYIYINRNLSMANIKNDESLIRESITILQDLRSAWKVIAEMPEENVAAKRSQREARETMPAEPIHSGIAVRA